MSVVDTRAKYRAALEIIARSECAHPEQVAQEAIYKPNKWRMKRHIISPGDRFGRLEVIYFCGRLKVTHIKGPATHADDIWLCWCDCGRLHIVKAASLVHDATRSCGCLRSEMNTTAARIMAFNRGPHFPTRLKRAIEKLRSSAKLRRENEKRKAERIRQQVRRDQLEATKRKLVPYAGYDSSGTGPISGQGNGWSQKLGLNRV